ncbi:MAG: hypothetical protein K6F81_00130, partial [Acholeplasmatales bacterium]|nr:hypothetical protein [Acholeplasmatales bacterium]
KLFAIISLIIIETIWVIVIFKIVDKTINSGIFIIVCFVIVNLVFFIVLGITSYLFKKALYKKTWKLFTFDKGMTRSEIEEEFGIYLGGASYFETIRPYKLSGKEIMKYQLYFDENDRFIKYETGYYRQWWTRHY